MSEHYDYWQHRTSGDVYAVRTDDAAQVTGVCGPLHHSEYDNRGIIADYDYRNDLDECDEMQRTEVNYRPYER